MKKIILISLTLLNVCAYAAPAVYKNIPKYFFSHLDTNLNTLWLDDEPTASHVKKLYEAKLLNHFIEDKERKQFEKYWEIYQVNWHLVDLNNDGENELLYNGKYETNDEIEYLEIYSLNKDSEYSLKHVENGILKAFNKNPNTGEIVLFQHQHPCCLKYIHSIFKVRFIKGEIISNKKNFIARDSGDMKGNFFPEQIENRASYHILENDSKLYWSNSIIDEKAFFNSQRKVNSNEICYYPKGSYYKILDQQDNWMYVLICGKAFNSENRIVNTDNLSMRPIFAWIRLKTKKS